MIDMPLVSQLFEPYGYNAGLNPRKFAIHDALLNQNNGLADPGVGHNASVPGRGPRGVLRTAVFDVKFINNLLLAHLYPDKAQVYLGTMNQHFAV